MFMTKIGNIGWFEIITIFEVYFEITVWYSVIHNFYTPLHGFTLDLSINLKLTLNDNSQ